MERARGHGGRARGPTMYDVAAAAEVAVSTVSRAFSHPQRVNAHTREHVLAVAEDLGYRPTASMGHGLQERVRTVALIVPDITNPHFFGIIRGAERHASAAGITLILADSQESADLEQGHVDRLARSVGGFVLASSRQPDHRIQELAARRIPVTLVNREVKGVPGAVVDPIDGSRQILDHLASLGHRSVVYLMGPRTSWLGMRRWRALSTAARRLGLRVDRLGPFPPAVEGGAAAADAALTHGATALIAHNDLLAIGLLRRLAERGIDVPRDISVVGHDDIFGADFCSPALTTLAGAFEEAGRAAVDLLLSGRGRQPGGDDAGRVQVVLPSHLVVRASSGPARSASSAASRVAGRA